MAKRRKPPATASTATVRMYNVGFGDAYLLTLPLAGRTHKVLFDCGSLQAGPQPMPEIVQAIVAAVTDADGVPRIDVVICTHRHKDHVSGFTNRLWETVEVQEVWMPWTEDPDDKDATRIRNAQARLALQLHASLTQKLAASPDDAELLGRQLLAANALTNESAMRTLHSGFSPAVKAKRSFFPTKTLARTIPTDALPGVTVHVLGPSRSETVLRNMDPPAGKGYLQFLDSCRSDGAAPLPFSPAWMVPLDREAELVGGLLLDDDEKQALAAATDLELAAAVALDAAVNNTSLVLAFEVGQTVLLFPGDAQWGTWEEILKDRAWRELLRRTKFYKVGHHASHNATPVEFVEQILGDDFWAMISVEPVKKWKSIPEPDLMDALRAKAGGKIAQSNKPREDTPGGFTRGANQLYVEARIPLGEP